MATTYTIEIRPDGTAVSATPQPQSQPQATTSTGRPPPSPPPPTTITSGPGDDDPDWHAKVEAEVAAVEKRQKEILSKSTAPTSVRVTLPPQPGDDGGRQGFGRSAPLMPRLPQPDRLPSRPKSPPLDPIMPENMTNQQMADALKTQYADVSAKMAKLEAVLHSRYPGRPKEWYGNIGAMAIEGMPEPEMMTPRGVRPLPRQKLAGEEVYKLASDEPKTFSLADTTPEARDIYGLRPEGWMPKRKAPADPPPPKDNPFGPSTPSTPSTPPIYEFQSPGKTYRERTAELYAQSRRDRQLKEEEAEAKRIREERAKEREERAKERAENKRAELQGRWRPLVNRMPAGLKPLLGAFGDKGGVLGGLADAAAGGAGMGGVGGMAGMAKLAGGPIGLALMAKDAVKSAIHSAGNMARESLEAFGNAATKIARNDMSVVSDAFTQTGSAVGKVTPVFGELIKTAGTLISIQQRVTQAFVDRGRELANYSGPLAAASAQADVKRMMADVREAQRHGNDLAKLIDKQADMEIAFREAIAPLKDVLIKHLTVLAERCVQFFDLTKPFMEVVAWSVEAMINLIASMPMVTMAKDIMDTLRDIKKNTAKPVPDVMPPINDWLNSLQAIGPGQDRVDPAVGNANAMLNAPVAFNAQ